AFGPVNDAVVVAEVIVNGEAVRLELRRAGHDEVLDNRPATRRCDARRSGRRRGAVTIWVGGSGDVVASGNDDCVDAVRVTGAGVTVAQGNSHAGNRSTCLGRSNCAGDCSVQIRGRDAGWELEAGDTS